MALKRLAKVSTPFVTCPCGLSSDVIERFFLFLEGVDLLWLNLLRQHYFCSFIWLFFYIKFLSFFKLPFQIFSQHDDFLQFSTVLSQKVIPANWVLNRSDWNELFNAVWTSFLLTWPTPPLKNAQFLPSHSCFVFLKYWECSVIGEIQRRQTQPSDGYESWSSENLCSWWQIAISSVG